MLPKSDVIKAIFGMPATHKIFGNTVANGIDVGHMRRFEPIWPVADTLCHVADGDHLGLVYAHNRKFGLDAKRTSMVFPFCKFAPRAFVTIKLSAKSRKEKPKVLWLM